ncbi:MAG: hypothetical protein L6R30_24720 [Thermoanaerobaculia bacterium]|nr:hypothetical protein [Thermoanaerobaculia bacterium]
MILPTKRIAEDRALLTIGGRVLALLDEPKTVSQVWDELSGRTATALTSAHLTFDWFVLALDLLYALGAVTYDRGRLARVTLA